MELRSKATPSAQAQRPGYRSAARRPRPAPSATPRSACRGCVRPPSAARSPPRAKAAPSGAPSRVGAPSCSNISHKISQKPAAVAARTLSIVWPPARYRECRHGRERRRRGAARRAAARLAAASAVAITAAVGAGAMRRHGIRARGGARPLEALLPNLPCDEQHLALSTKTTGSYQSAGTQNNPENQK